MRFVLAAATALLAVNIWTGAPLLAIWLGSRVQGGTSLTGTTVLVVLGVLSVTVALLVWGLMHVEAAYKHVTGQPTHRRTAPWMRSLRDERLDIHTRRTLTGFEKVLVGAVVAAVLTFEVWFFFFAGSSIGTN